MPTQKAWAVPGLHFYHICCTFKFQPRICLTFSNTVVMTKYLCLRSFYALQLTTYVSELKNGHLTP